MVGLNGAEPKPATESKLAADPYVWLEDVTGEKPMAWVKARNAAAEKELVGTESFQKLESEIRRIMDPNAKIPYVNRRGAWLYNFWKDAQNPRGVWRRTTLDEYRKADPKWDVVLDIDALGKAEKESWVFHGAEFLKPDHRRCLVSLSRGGSDACVVREFDVETKTFVKDGFQLAEAKSEISWIDADTVFVGTDFGPGSMTTSGYARIVKVWKRGTPLASARTVFEVKDTDMVASAYHDATPGFERDFVVKTPSFFTSEMFLLGKDGSQKRVEIPSDAEGSVFREWLLVKPRTAWTVNGKTYPSGSLLATRFDDYMAGKRQLVMLFEPTATTSLEGFSWTRHHLILNVLDDVKNRLSVLTPVETGDWKREPFLGAPDMGSVSVSGVDADASDDYFMDVTDFLTPATLCMGRVGGKPETLKSAPAFFDASRCEISQHFVTSKDGTRVPYFQVSPKGLKLDGSHPTLLGGYGGFEVSEIPYYSGALGKAWLEKGGVYVLANIRGGGEYGPRWHQAALKQNRMRAYEDFAAVAQDLAARKVTSPKHLGIQGGSNGGLLVGNMLTHYPQLLGAVVCQVPLLDMKRYSHLLAGASWMAEYGDPDKPEEWAFIQTFSPYHNLKSGVNYPPTFFMTTTRDDRVHPAHARKMMAKMQEMGANVRYFENTEGGHGAGADSRQAAHFSALAYTFLWNTLKK
ncbi:MAG TPA: prolyl oligopeptidase family serine peptidase [Holophaga sp.]|nr:prolyl oligopeptidase family serine peptidase [Holophaga sp.]